MPRRNKNAGNEKSGNKSSGGNKRRQRTGSAKSRKGKH